MTQLTWFSINPPRDINHQVVTAAIRSLASRPRMGTPPATPIVVFELWSIGGHLAWLLGVDSLLADELPTQLQAHVPRLALTYLPNPNRPVVTVGATVHSVGLAAPLRTDVAGAISAQLYATLTRLHSTEAAVLQWTIGSAQSRTHAPEPFDVLAALGIREKRRPDTTTRRLFREKAREPLFVAACRIGATTSNPHRAVGIVQRLDGALKLANAEHAGLRLDRFSAHHAHHLVQAIRPVTWGCMLSASEIAALLGWPVQDQVADDVPVVGGHIGMVPEQLLVEDSEDVTKQRCLGESLHPAKRGQLVQMPANSGPYHLHLIGPTGSGKSTLLTHLILADIAAGRGVLVLEPRGDLMADVLARIPVERRDDVVIIDPADAATYGAVGLNVLAGPLETAERRADELVALLATMAGSNWGPRTADVALHAILTISKLSDGVLPDVVALLTNSTFRRNILGKVSDPLVLGPWWSTYDAMSDGERGQHIAPLLNKLRPLLSRNALRHMLGQAQSRFSFDDLFTKRRIVLVNLNAGLLGGPAANLLGALILSQVWSSLQRRAAIPRERRAMTGLFVDEFQGYTNMVGGLDFGEALAQSRALGGAWTLAHQHFAQLNNALEAAVIANARSRVSFRPGADDAKALAASFASNLTAADLLRLGSYEAVAQIHLDGKPTQPFAIRTRPLGPHISDADDLRRASAERYATDGASVDQALTERWHGQASTDGPIGARPRRRS